MSAENPYKSDSTSETVADASKSDGISSGKATYNIVSDTVVGLNMRKGDNKFQAIFVFISVVALAAVGAILAILNSKWNLPWYGGALFGGLAGMVIGIFASGIFLMIYRAVRHLKGKHD